MPGAMAMPDNQYWSVSCNSCRAEIPICPTSYWDDRNPEWEAFQVLLRCKNPECQQLHAYLYLDARIVVFAEPVPPEAIPEYYRAKRKPH
jgi:hypothetical protein